MSQERRKKGSLWQLMSCLLYTSADDISCLIEAPQHTAVIAVKADCHAELSCKMCIRDSHTAAPVMVLLIMQPTKSPGIAAGVKNGKMVSASENRT